MFNKKLLSKVLIVLIMTCFAFASMFMLIQLSTQMIYAKSNDHNHGSVGDADFISFSYEISNTFTGGTLDSGNYYLTEDIDQITEQVIIAENANVNICLKGHSMKLYADGAAERYKSLYVKKGATLSIYDCEENAGKIYLSDVTNGYMDISGSLKIYNGSIENCTNSESLSVNGYLLVGENASIINTGKGSTIFCDSENGMDIYGQVLQNYEGSEATPTAISTEKASPKINIYNSTVVKSKKGLDFNLNCDKDTVLFVKETLTGEKTFRYHYWSTTSQDSEWLAVKKESTNQNTNAEFKSYFTYVSSTGMFFDQSKENGDIEIVMFKATTQPTSKNVKFETNRSDATYEWYKVNNTTGTITNSDLAQDTNVITCDEYDSLTNATYTDSSKSYYVRNYIKANITTSFTNINVCTSSKLLQSDEEVCVLSLEPFTFKVRLDDKYYSNSDVASDYDGYYEYDSTNDCFTPVFVEGFYYAYLGFTDAKGGEKYSIELSDRLIIAKITSDNLISGSTSEYEAEFEFSGDVVLEYENVALGDKVNSTNTITNPEKGSYICKATWNGNVISSSVCTITGNAIDTITFTNCPVDYKEVGSVNTMVSTPTFASTDLVKFDVIASYVQWGYGFVAIRVKDGYSIELKQGSTNADITISGVPADKVNYAYVMKIEDANSLSSYAAGQTNVQVGDYLVIWGTLNKLVPIIKTQPAKDNDYTITVDDTYTEETYQWYTESKQSYFDSFVTSSAAFATTDVYLLTDPTEFIGSCSYFAGNLLYPAKESDTEYHLKFTVYAKDPTAEVEFKFYAQASSTSTTIDLSNLPEHEFKDNYYIFKFKGSLTLDLTENQSFYIWYLTASITTGTAINNANSPHFGYTLTDKGESDLALVLQGDVSYYCIVTTKDGKTERSDSLTPHFVAYNVSNLVVGTMPSMVYQLEGRKVTLDAGNIMEYNKVFDKWEYNNVNYNGGTEFTVGNADAVINPVWRNVVKVEPSKDNQYQLTVDETLTDVTYQWVQTETTKEVLNETKFNSLFYFTNLKTKTFSEGHNSVEASGSGQYYSLSLYFNPVSGLLFEFTTDKEYTFTPGDGFSNYGTITYLGNNKYRYNPIEQYGYLTLYISTNEAFTITDLETVKVEGTPIENQTSTKFTGTNLINTEYYCYIYKGSVLIGETAKSTPVSIAFDGNEATSGSVNGIYELEGREITIPENGFTKVGNKCIGWNTNNKATSALSFTNGKYTVGNSNVTFYAIWQEKAVVSISDSPNTNTYNGKAQAYEIAGTNKDLSSYKIEYFVSEEWTENTPVNAGSYDVKISRLEDDTYKAYELKITKGLVIKRLEVTATTNYEDEFTYNGQDQSSSVKASYKDVSGNTVALVMYSCLPGNVNKSVSVPFTDAGCYTMLFKFATDEEKSNYCFANDSNIYEDYYTMLEKEITIDWEAQTYTYNGESLTIPVVSYQDVNNQKVALTVSMDKEFKNAGTYVATVSFANEEANYCLPTTVTKEYSVNKLGVVEPSVSGSYKYNGEAQTVVLIGLENYMTTTDNLTQTNAGVYTISFALDDNHEWNENNDGVITWEIKQTSVTPNEEKPGEKKHEVIIEAPDGFTNDITVEVEVTVETEVETKELTVDYYNISNEAAKLENNEKVGVVFEVKLVQTINGVSKTIQPEDIAPGTKIKVKMLIPENVDLSKVTRILHVHSATDIEEIEFDASKVVDGYYEIEVSRLSEFAFVYKVETEVEAGLPVWAIILIALACLCIIIIGLFIIWKREFDKANEKNQLEDRKLKWLDPIYRPINKILFEEKKKNEKIKK